MALISGHGGSVSGPGPAANVGKWTLDSTIDAIDVPTMGTAAKNAIKQKIGGLTDWTCSLEFFHDEADNPLNDKWSVGEIVATTILDLKSPDKITLTNALITRVQTVKDVAGAVSGTMDITATDSGINWTIA